MAHSISRFFLVLAMLHNEMKTLVTFSRWRIRARTVHFGRRMAFSLASASLGIIVPLAIASSLLCHVFRDKELGDMLILFASGLTVFTFILAVVARQKSIRKEKARITLQSWHIVQCPGCIHFHSIPGHLGGPISSVIS